MAALLAANAEACRDKDQFGALPLHIALDKARPCARQALVCGTLQQGRESETASGTQAGVPHKYGYVGRDPFKAVDSANPLSRALSGTIPVPSARSQCTRFWLSEHTPLALRTPLSARHALLRCARSTRAAATLRCWLFSYLSGRYAAGWWVRKAL